jgi:hypothetical protein
LAQDRVGFATSVSYTEPVQPAPTEHRQTTAARDSSAVSSTWAPPSGPAITPDRRTIPASLIYGTILLVLVLLVVAVCPRASRTSVSHCITARSRSQPEGLKDPNAAHDQQKHEERLD